MGLNASKVESTRPLTPTMEAGTYPARLVQVVDLGVQSQRAFKGEEKPPIQQFMLTYEFVDEFLLDEDGEPMNDKPRWLSETMPLYSLDADRAKSTLRYKAFDPELKFEGDFVHMLGRPINVTVVVNPGKGKNLGRDFANVGGISPMRSKDVESCPDVVNVPTVFDFDDPDAEAYLKLPKWVQEKVTEALNYPGSSVAQMVEHIKAATPQDAEETSDGLDDEIPF